MLQLEDNQRRLQHLGDYSIAPFYTLYPCTRHAPRSV